MGYCWASCRHKKYHHSVRKAPSIVSQVEFPAGFQSQEIWFYKWERKRATWGFKHSHLRCLYINFRLLTIAVSPLSNFFELTSWTVTALHKGRLAAHTGEIGGGWSDLERWNNPLKEWKNLYICYISNPFSFTDIQPFGSDVAFWHIQINFSLS